MSQELIQCQGGSCRSWRPADQFVNKLTGQRTKLCLQCREHHTKSMKKRHTTKVMPYRREYDRKQKYGLSLGEYDRMLKAQDGKCAICERVEGDHKTYEVLAVDHDKETGRVRALLCGQCNAGIGLLQHDVEILRKAIEYINRFRDPQDIG